MTDITTPVPSGTDIGEVLAGYLTGRSRLVDATGADAIGLVAASPAPYSFLGRIKTATDALGLQTSADDLFAITPSDSVALTTIPKALLCTVAGNVAVRGTGSTPVTIPVTIGQILPIRARYVYATGTTATVIGLV